jgi:putative hydrolase of the HAD superfamily
MFRADGFRAEGPQTLFIDADDTLWENNIYFEDAWAEFEEFLGHSTLRGAELRAIFDEIEIANIKVNGYGAENFGRNMVNCYRHLAERAIGEGDLERIMGFARRIVAQPIEMLEGVEETLDYLLHRNHDLILYTKGQEEEQRLKIDRSPVGRFFRSFEVVREKDEAAYRGLGERYGLDGAVTWMIGNSPKSDVNPALAVGWNAVFVPHARTWGLEKMELGEAREGRRKLVVENFRGLREIF